MTSFLILIACGATYFVEQDIPDLRAGSANRLTHEAWRNYRTSDMDGDGLGDVVLPRAVAFQRAGVFRKEDRVDLPYVEESPQCEIWGSQIYIRRDVGLVVAKRGAKGWEEVLNQSIAWPESAVPSESPLTQRTATHPGIRFERFLHDFEADGIPEIVLAQVDGLHILKKGTEGYAKTTVLSVFPPLRITPPGSAQLWPPEKRRLTMPDLGMSCRVFLDGPKLTVLERDYPGHEQVRYRTRRFTLDCANSFGIIADRTVDKWSLPMPGDTQPLRLNSDEEVDYVGAERSISRASLVPAPMFSTWASTDGGRTRQTVQMRWFSPHCMFVDYDGDGDLDMISESSDLFEGGAREVVGRLVTKTVVMHEVRIHLQDSEGKFSHDPSVRGRFTIETGAVPASNDELFWRYSSGGLLDMTGDFNGDGRRDIVVRDKPGRLAVYLGAEDGFERSPCATIPVETDWSFAIDDVDGDGLSDVVAHWVETGGADGFESCRVFLTRERAL